MIDISPSHITAIAAVMIFVALNLISHFCYDVMHTAALNYKRHIPRGAGYWSDTLSGVLPTLWGWGLTPMLFCCEHLHSDVTHSTQTWNSAMLYIIFVGIFPALAAQVG